MRLTPRDLTLLRDLALSHVLSRDQIISLDYFGSATRLNSRLRDLTACRLVSVLVTRFSQQHLYVAGTAASSVVGERIAQVIHSRPPSPRFLQHALTVTNTRIALIRNGATSWRYETQLWCRFTAFNRQFEIRPDGMVWIEDLPTVVEVDLGHVAPAKFAQKLRAYELFALSGELKTAWHVQRLAVLTLTTGPLRKRHLARLAPQGSPVRFRFATLEEYGIDMPGGWS